MLISKTKLGELFFNYTKVIYNELGHSLSQKQKTILKNRIDKQINEYTLINVIKKKLKKKWK